MKTVTLQVATLEEVKRRTQDAFKGKKQGARISFATPELLFRLMTAKRWELIRATTGAGPLTIREVARRRWWPSSHKGACRRRPPATASRRYSPAPRAEATQW